MTFKPHFWTNYNFVLNSCTFRVSHFPVSHLTYETVKLGLQNTLNMSKTTRVYFGVLQNWSSMGGFIGLLDMAVSSNGPVGCSRMAKASEIGRSLGSECTQALAYRL